MISDAEIVGRVEMYCNPMKFENTLSKFKRKAVNPRYVQHLFNDVLEVYPNADEEELRETFISLVYQIYAPLSFIENKKDKRKLGKLPIGVRDEMAKLMNLASPEMINYYKGYVDNWMKPDEVGVQRPFRVKVMALVDRFLPYSINKNDSQTKLF